VSPTGTTGISKAGRNAVVTSLMVCCGFIICFTPYEILVTVAFSSHTVDFGSWYYHLMAVLMFSNSIINPFIYAAKYREFQQAARRLLAKIIPIQQLQSQSSAIT